MDEKAIAIVGGTGDQGLGLAMRWAKAGRHVVIGSRKEERAKAAAEAVQGNIDGASVVGFENRVAISHAKIVVLSVPFESVFATVKHIRDGLQDGQILISMAVPLATSYGGPPSQMAGVWQGSCAELVASMVPDTITVVSAFQNVSAHRLAALADDVECDVVVSGARAARETVIDLCALIPGLRGIDGGPLANARTIEAMTALLIGINRRYKIPEGTGIRFTGLP